MRPHPYPGGVGWGWGKECVWPSASSGISAYSHLEFPKVCFVSLVRNISLTYRKKKKKTLYCDTILLLLLDLDLANFYWVPSPEYHLGSRWNHSYSLDEEAEAPVLGVKLQCGAADKYLEIDKYLEVQIFPARQSLLLQKAVRSSSSDESCRHPEWRVMRLSSLTPA